MFGVFWAKRAQQKHLMFLIILSTFILEKIVKQCDNVIVKVENG